VRRPLDERSPPPILGQNLKASRELIVSGASEISAALGFASERAVAAE
jgi:hypothetical protein